MLNSLLVVVRFNVNIILDLFGLFVLVCKVEFGYLCRIRMFLGFVWLFLILLMIDKVLSVEILFCMKGWIVFVLVVLSDRNC